MSRTKTFVFYALSLLVMFAVFEVFASTILIYLYRFHGTVSAEHENAPLSSMVFLSKVFDALRGEAGVEVDPEQTTVEPKPYFIEDPKIGYYTPPGKYTMTFRRRYNKFSQYEYLKAKLTFADDSTRWTGDTWKSTGNTIYVFGDSYIFGYGVNDEQTFSYLLRQSLKNTNVKLVANAGYSLIQAFINFERIKNDIGENDIIILGYADFYKPRHVAAPSWTKEWGEPPPFMPSNLTYPKASLDANANIQIGHAPLYCKFNPDYCQQADPPQEEQDKVTTALINHIARNTRAKVYLLHIHEAPGDQVLKLIDKNISIISALPRDFDYLIMDDILGFDPHPGPWWHYAMFKKLAETLPQATPGVAVDENTRRGRRADGQD